MKDMEKVKTFQDKQEETQKKIIRQTCIKAAAETFQVPPNAEIKWVGEKVIELAKMFEEYVNDIERKPVK